VEKELRDWNARKRRRVRLTPCEQRRTAHTSASTLRWRGDNQSLDQVRTAVAHRCVAARRGIERSHFLPDKDPREFDLVFDVKSDGWFNLCTPSATCPQGDGGVQFDCRTLGNGGQTDYSAATTCCARSRRASGRPVRRHAVLYRLDGVGWYWHGHARLHSQEMEVAGIDMLPPEAGVP